MVHLVIQGCSRTGRSGRWASKIAEARARARYEWYLGPKLEVCATGRCSFTFFKNQLVASSYYLLGTHAEEEGKTERMIVSTLNVVNAGWMEQCVQAVRGRRV